MSTTTHPASAARPTRPGAPAAPGAHGVRLTRRGRLLVLVVALLVALAAGVLLAQASMADDDAAPEATRVVVVTPGTTLWGLASEAADADEDVQSLVTEIRELNDLESGALQAGQELRVPLG